MNRALPLLSVLLLVGCPAPKANNTPPPPPPAEPDKPSKPAEPAAPAEAEPHPALLDPSKATEQAPETYKASFETSKGTFVVEVTRAWAPKGADRFYNLVKIGYFDDARFFRVLQGFMAQFGINGDPEVNAQWKEAKISDDPVTQSNTKGMVTFATAGKDTRTTQVFINYANNRNLDRMGFAPFGKVVAGMDVVEKFFGKYGEGAPRGRGPAQGLIQSEGNSYLERAFPRLDYVKKAKIVQ